MQTAILTITENLPLTASVMRMRLSGDLSGVKRPGQFVNIKIDGLYLRRPISVCDIFIDIYLSKVNSLRVFFIDSNLQPSNF